MRAKQKYLLFCGDNATVVYLPTNLASEDYERFRFFFCTTVGGKDDDLSGYRKLEEYECYSGIYYTGELAGPDGMSFEIYQFPGGRVIDEQALACAKYLRRTQDAVRISILKFRRLYDMQADVNRMFDNTPHQFGTWRKGLGNGEGSIFLDGEGRMEYSNGTTLTPICSVYDFHGDREYLLDLISAAPDLLLGLESLLALLTPEVWDQLPLNAAGGPDDVNRIADNCRNAVRKARGIQP